jgi:hypothetical protein
MMEEVTGYVYFIQMDRIGPIKIGFTKDIGKRLLSLQVGSPYPLRLLLITPGNERFEKEIHSCLNNLRMEGEWFLPHPKLLKEIEFMRSQDHLRGFIEPNPKYDIRPGLLTPEYDKWYQDTANCHKEDPFCKNKIWQMLHGD